MKAMTFLDLLRWSPIPRQQSDPELCPRVLRIGAQKGKSMQNGSMMRTKRYGGPGVWEFRWRELGPDGKPKHRTCVPQLESSLHPCEPRIRKRGPCLLRHNAMSFNSGGVY